GRTGPGMLGRESLGGGTGGDLGLDRADRPARGRAPLDAGGGLHSREDGADRIRVLDDDRGGEQPGPGDHPLSRADRLDPAGDIDAVLTGTVLARDLAEAGVDSDPAQHLDVVETEAGEPGGRVR